ncbi:DUF2796 domain-containing protein [Alphaproteobacteria bacterium]|nr:DUF2796 domain-containing protein [Alphaproteobacteria bacterium]
MVTKILKLSVLSFIALSFSAKAEDAHVHGEAVLEVVIDDAGALLRFEAPAIDIVLNTYQKPMKSSRRLTQKLHFWVICPAWRWCPAQPAACWPKFM